MRLLKQDIADALDAAADLVISAEDRAAWSARTGPVSSADPKRVLSQDGDTTVLTINGVLTPKPDILAWLFGGGNTAYSDIIAAVDEIKSKGIAPDKIRLDMHSGGGDVDGLFEAAAALESLGGNIPVRTSCACSAAYMLAAITGPIEATGRAAQVGSIGVMTARKLDPSVVAITSTNAPNKRPDAGTPEGQAVIREQLDAIEDLFIEAIATGRNVAVETVKKDFGRGAVLLADAALSRGMINSIAKPARVERSKGAAAVAAAPVQSRKTHMDEKELKAQHPELYAAVFAKGKDEGIEAGKSDGVTAERKRVAAHLKMAASSGAVKVAHDAIASGASCMDEDVFAEYQAAAMNRASQVARDDDAASASAAVAGAVAAAPVVAAAAEPDLQEQAMALLESGKGSVRA